MKLFKKLFGEINMTWLKVIIFAVVTGAYTAVINLIPTLEDTSFKDIAISYEWWILFAVIIAANCKKPIESGLKVFVFFLISQPLVYLIETPFLGAEVWKYYTYWLIITLLTLPGGMIANFIRKKNFIGSLVLSVAVGILANSAALYIINTYCTFPHHLLTSIFCILQIIIYIAFIIEQKKCRIFTAMVATIVFIITGFITLNTKSTVETSLPEGENWTIALENNDDKMSDITENGNYIIFTYNPAFVKDNVIICTNSNGETKKYKVIVGDNKSVNVIPSEE